MYANTLYPNLFSPLKVGPITLKNRLSFSPMVCNKCTLDGEVTDEMVEFIYNQAATGVSYVTIGDTQIDKETGGCFLAELDVTSERCLPGLRRLAEAARFGGASLSVELSHSGRGAHDDLITKPAFAPSAIPMSGCAKNPRAATQEDIDFLIGRFVECADRVRRAGFPMVMIHCAHNNMLGQWLSPLSNVREDEYGGSAENRMRLPLRVLRSVREKLGDSMAIEVRVSAEEVTPGGIEFSEALEFMERAQEYCDIIHVSRGIIYNREAVWTLPTYLKPEALNLEFAAEAKKHLRVPVTTVGNFTSLALAEQAIADGKADIVAMARFHLADFEGVKKSLAGRADSVRPCLRCHRGCIDNSATGDAIHCSVNATLGFESLLRSQKPISSGKRVIVVGGGPAGLEAARRLAENGNNVTLYEKTDKLGGLLLDAAAAPFKTYLRRYLEWSVNSVKEAGVNIVLETEVTPELILRKMPDAVIVATGSDYVNPHIPGISGKKVISLQDAEHHRKPVGDRVVVCGGGIAGCECALALSLEGHAVTVIDALPRKKLCRDMPFLPRTDLFRALEEHGVEILVDTKVLRFSPEGVTVEGPDGKFTIACDTAVKAFGVKPNISLLEALQSHYSAGVYPAGDCAGGKNIYDATHTALFAAMKV